MGLKLGQYPNGRCSPVTKQCQMLRSHPRSYEPPFHCDKNDCVTCQGLAMGRLFINDCYAFQHRENSRPEIQGKVR